MPWLTGTESPARVPDRLLSLAPVVVSSVELVDFVVLCWDDGNGVSLACGWAPLLLLLIRSYSGGNSSIRTTLIFAI